MTRNVGQIAAQSATRKTYIPRNKIYLEEANYQIESKKPLIVFKWKNKLKETS